MDERLAKNMIDKDEFVGDKDELVPTKHSQDIYAAFQKANVASELIVLEGAGHGFEGEHARRAVDALAAWFEKYLAAPYSFRVTTWLTPVRHDASRPPLTPPASTRGQTCWPGTGLAGHWVGRALGWLGTGLAGPGLGPAHQ